MANVFPKWSNRVPLMLLVGALLLGTAIASGVSYYFTPKYTRVGYAPVQPVPFSHALHAGQLGLDCRYCHTNVEVAGHANIPDAGTCMACHNQIKTDSPLLQPVRDAWAGGSGNGPPVEWVRVHQVPDYVYFNHAAHVNRGISCAECHGAVHEMEVVRHEKSFSMAWCLECHRNPEQFIRPPEEVYNLDWKPSSHASRVTQGKEFVHDWKVLPPESCSGCHR